MPTKLGPQQAEEPCVSDEGGGMKVSALREACPGARLGVRRESREDARAIAANYPAPHWTALSTD